MNRILFINSKFSDVGGGETYTQELMNFAKEAGYEVHLITYGNLESTEFWQGCEVHKVPGFVDNSLDLMGCLPKIHKIIQSINPDIVHVHNIVPLFVYSSIVEKGEYPTVVTIHNTPQLGKRVFGSLNDYQTEVDFVRELLAQQKYDRIFFGSHYYEESYLKIAPIIKGKTQVAHYFPPSLVTKNFCRKQSVDGRVRILFPSRVIKRKGIEDALEALALLPSNFVMDIPGFGASEDIAYVAYLMDKIILMNLEDRIIMSKAKVGPQDMHEHYEHADVVVIPSHYEGFGIVAVEAMFYKKPIVGTRVGGLSEILCEDNSFVVNLSDPEGIAEAIQQAVERIELSALKVGRASNTLLQFSREKHLQYIEEEYSALLKRHVRV